MKNSIKTILVICLLGLPLFGFSKGVYQTDEAFLNEVFSGNAPKTQILWLSGNVKINATKIMGHAYSRLRVKYWKRGIRTVWILEEIGKEKPITTGIVIDDNRIERIKVLAFRETRGWEVKHAFFTNQFRGIQLKSTQPDAYLLDQPIDGITGATLSVNALRKLSRLALYLDQYVAEKTPA